jgi:hypothetical protein
MAVIQPTLFESTTSWSAAVPAPVRRPGDVTPLPPLLPFLPTRHTPGPQWPVGVLQIPAPPDLPPASKAAGKSKRYRLLASRRSGVPKPDPPPPLLPLPAPTAGAPERYSPPLNSQSNTRITGPLWAAQPATNSTISAPSAPAGESSLPVGPRPAGSDRTVPPASHLPRPRQSGGLPRPLSKWPPGFSLSSPPALSGPPGPPSGGGSSCRFSTAGTANGCPRGCSEPGSVAPPIPGPAGESESPHWLPAGATGRTVPASGRKAAPGDSLSDAAGWLRCPPPDTSSTIGREYGGGFPPPALSPEGNGPFGVARGRASGFSTPHLAPSDTIDIRLLHLLASLQVGSRV